MKHILIAFGLVGLGPWPAWAEATDYPLHITNCGKELTFDAAPARTVTIGQAATEILYALGLADTVVGTSVWFNPVLPQFAQVNAEIPRLADNDPSFESVVAQKPEMIAVQYEWHVGQAGVVGTREMFDDLGINSYILPSDCDTKDNTSGNDGVRVSAFQPEAIYKAIHELALINDVASKGAALTRSLQSTQAQAVAQAKSLTLPDDMSAVFWFSSPDIQTDPYVAGRWGAPGYMMRALGLRNVITSDEEWPTVGWETIAKADPDIIVLAKMDRRRYRADDIELKREFLRTDPVTREMRAVREGHIIEMDAHAMSPTLRTFYGLETLSNALAALTAQ